MHTRRACRSASSWSHSHHQAANLAPDLPPRLVGSISKINDNCLLEDVADTLDVCLVRSIMANVIVPVLGRGELDDEAMRQTILACLRVSANIKACLEMGASSYLHPFNRVVLSSLQRFDVGRLAGWVNAAVLECKEARACLQIVDIRGQSGKVLALQTLLTYRFDLRRRSLRFETEQHSMHHSHGEELLRFPIWTTLDNLRGRRVLL